MSTIDTRREQMFPKLEPREIDRLRRFGDVRRYSAGEALFVTGEIAPGMVVLIKGSVRVTRRDPLGHHAPIAEQGAGEFVAEVGQLSGQPAFVDVHAIDDVEALLITKNEDAVEHFLVPIDACYELAGRMRLTWRGFDGGSEARHSIDDFLGTVRSRARQLARGV